MTIIPASNYIDLFNNFVDLADKEFMKWEELASKETNLHDLASHLPALVGICNMVGYLRGQDGCFLDFRPQTDQQNYFYKKEDEFEKRLSKLIDLVLASKEADYYTKRINSYYTLVRTNKAPEVY